VPSNPELNENEGTSQMTEYKHSNNSLEANCGNWSVRSNKSVSEALFNTLLLFKL